MGLEKNLVALGAWEGPKGGNLYGSESGKLVCFDTAGVFSYFMSEERFLVGVS